MWFYDQTFLPPAPKLDVQVFLAGIRAQSVSLRAKLDIGAGVTVIPERLVTLLDLPSHDNTLARGYDGSHRLCPTYRIDLKFNGFEVDWIDCIATEREDVLLGRNILNLFFITLDGPNLTFDMKQE